MPAGQVPAWRTRVQYRVDQETGRVGLRKHRSHEVQLIDRCLIAAEGVTELGVESRDWTGLESVEAIAATGSSDRQLIMRPLPGEQLPLVELDKPVSLGRVDEQELFHKVHGRSFVRERAGERTWRVSNGGFWQIHPEAPDTLVAAVLDGLDPQWGERARPVLRGGPVRRRAGRPGRRGRRGAGHRVGQAGGGRRPAQPGRAGAGADRVRQGGDPAAAHRDHRHRPDRAGPAASGGGRATVAHLASLGARRIAYVACDPAALARDLAFFAEGGYRPVSLRAFDLFPMTHHFECVAILEPTGPEPDERRS